jgi:hypothetical protein
MPLRADVLRAIAAESRKQLKENNMNTAAAYWKSILAFLASVATNLAGGGQVGAAEE